MTNRIFWAAYATMYDLLWENELTALTSEAVIAELDGTRKRVCEVGAGTGLMTRHLEEAGWSVDASEPNPSMAARFARRLPGTACQPLTIEGVTESAAPSIDVIAVNVLHLTPDPGTALSQLRLIAGPDRRVIVVTPDPETSVIQVARAQRRWGASRWQTLRFWLLHLLLAPLTKSLRPRPLNNHLPDFGTESASQRISIAGVYLLLVFRGLSEADQKWSTRPRHPDT